MNKYKFNCGCEFPIISWPKGHSIPLLCIEYNDILNKMESCPAVWNLFAKGMTNGVFQLESGLGKHYCKQMRPENIEHLSILTAVLRPACLQSYEEKGKNLTRNVCD